MTTRRIVVGIDDSGSARRALRWAIDEAAMLDAELDVVHAYTEPVVVVPAPLVGAPPAVADSKGRAKALLHRLTSEALACAPHRPRAVQELAVEGHPGRTLVSCAHTGDVLVVGSRGHSALASVTLGSCSNYCVHHACCPVIVVPSAAW